LKKAVKFIVSLQTISDYLDNLCDRAGVFDEKAFLQLHLSMLEAVDPSLPLSNYYELYPYKNDSGYLMSLVETCRSQVRDLPSYNLVVTLIKKYIRLYCEMQSYKHISLEERESRLTDWSKKYLCMYTGISCWEFSAAAGSTLGVFVLFAAAFNPYLTPREVTLIDEAYFPWICGLHILLDYYIDSQEDMQTGDLNFTYYYENLKQCEDRLLLFTEHSLEYCTQLPYPKFHATIIKGLLSMYLSDPKASVGLNRITSRRIIRGKGIDTKFYYNLCRFLRTINKL
jgi:tetraprenyl-beta-curcumene synthase